MIEAAVRGVMDFSKAEFFNPIWQRQFRATLRGLQMLNAREQADIRHRHYCSLLAAKIVQAEQQDELQQSAIDELHKYEDAFLPNAAKLREEAERQHVKGQISKWEEKWGKMSDPKVQERIQRTADALRKARAETARQEEQGTIESLMGVTGRQRRNVSAARR